MRRLLAASPMDPREQSQDQFVVQILPDGADDVDVRFELCVARRTVRILELGSCGESRCDQMRLDLSELRTRR